MVAENIREFTEANFDSDVLASTLPVLVDFWAVWCGPCHAVGPILEAVAQETEGKLRVGKVNVDEHPDLAARYGITSIPTMLVFKGGELVDQITGAVPKSRIMKTLQPVLRAAGNP